MSGTTLTYVSTCTMWNNYDDGTFYSTPPISSNPNDEFDCAEWTATYSGTLAIAFGDFGTGNFEDFANLGMNVLFTMVLFTIVFTYTLTFLKGIIKYFLKRFSFV